MRHNAITTVPVILYRVWGPDDAPLLDLLAGAKVFVLYSPIHRRHIMSVTSHDARYDSFVEPYHFKADPSLRVVEEEDGPTYYLNRVRGKLGVA